ncbi:hypothetical protein KJA13_03120, partial [Patescibacteria group bacterium]|nr:hypothetical protein [Patescibacteria group bacterium]
MLFTKRGIIIALAVSFMIIFGSGDSLAANSKPNLPKKGDKEVSAGVALPLLPLFAVGWYANDNVEFEANVVFWPGACADAYIIGSISYNWPIERFIPYVTGGVGTCAHGYPLWAIGGGLKIKLTEGFSIRAVFIYGSFFG